MWVVPVVVVAVFDRVAKEAAAPRFTRAGLAKARAVWPVPNVSTIANEAIIKRRIVLLSGRQVELYMLHSPPKFNSVPESTHPSMKPKASHSKLTTNTPQPHPSVGGCLSPPLGGGRFGSGDDVTAQRQGYGFRAAGDAQLGKDVADVGFDGGWADG